jgi:uncharacterized protein YggE
MRFTTFAAMAFVIIALSACNGSDPDSDPPEGSARGPSGLSGNSAIARYVGDLDLGAGVGNGPSLQGFGDGITVTGYGEASAPPTGATIRLTISTGDPFIGSDSFNIDFIEADDLEPVVDAIKAQGVDEDDISVNAFAQSQFGYGQGAAEVTFQWPRPDGVTELAEEIQNVIRRETDYALASFQILYTVSDCESLETKAQEGALEDARRKAVRLGDLAVLHVEDIKGIVEGGGLASIYGLQSGCASLKQFPADFFSAGLNNSATEVTIDATLSVTFGTE